MRVFIAHENAEIRLGLHLLLDQEPGVIVVGMAVRANGLVEQVAASRPDVLIINWHLPGGSVPDALAHLRSSTPQLKMVAMSMRPEVEQEAVTAGADGCVSLDKGPVELLHVLGQLRETRHTGQ